VNLSLTTGMKEHVGLTRVFVRRKVDTTLARSECRLGPRFEGKKEAFDGEGERIEG
jgi:hypothetical protein